MVTCSLTSVSAWSCCQTMIWPTVRFRRVNLKKIESNLDMRKKCYVVFYAWHVFNQLLLSLHLYLFHSFIIFNSDFIKYLIFLKIGVIGAFNWIKHKVVVQALLALRVSSFEVNVVFQNIFTWPNYLRFQL